MSNTEKTSTPHICGHCGASEIVKTRIGGENFWLCKCGERWRTHSQDWDKVPEFVRGKRVYKRDRKPKP